MTFAERRAYPRYNPEGLIAKIRLESRVPPTLLEGEVLDISCTGIKIRLSTPSSWEMAGKIRIDLYLPDSGIPFSIRGILRHQAQPGDLGIEYVDTGNLIEMDKFLFECVKLTKANGSTKSNE